MVQIVFSWQLLRLVERKGLSVLGLVPTGQRLKQFSIGFLIATFCCAFYFLLLAKLVQTNWVVNSQITGKIILEGMGWNIQSVLFEELLFRGALLYLLMSRLGVKKGCILSAVCFGIYHWFSFEAIGNPVNMLMVFVMTGVMGLVLAFSFAKTESLYLPIALHLGWNATNISVFSNGPLGPQLLMTNASAPTVPLGNFLSILMLLLQNFSLPLLAYWYLKVLERKAILLRTA